MTSETVKHIAANRCKGEVHIEISVSEDNFLFDPDDPCPAAISCTFLANEMKEKQMPHYTTQYRHQKKRNEVKLKILSLRRLQFKALCNKWHLDQRVSKHHLEQLITSIPDEPGATSVSESVVNEPTLQQQLSKKEAVPADVHEESYVTRTIPCKEVEDEITSTNVSSTCSSPCGVPESSSDGDCETWDCSNTTLHFEERHCETKFDQQQVNAVMPSIPTGFAGSNCSDSVIECEHETLLESYYSISCSFDCEAEMPTGVPESDSSDCSFECVAETIGGSNPLSDPTLRQHLVVQNTSSGLGSSSCSGQEMQIPNEDIERGYGPDGDPDDSEPDPDDDDDEDDDQDEEYPNDWFNEDNNQVGDGPFDYPPEAPDNPDDPDDPDDPDPHEPPDNQHDNEDDFDIDDDNFDLVLEELQVICRSINACSVKEALAMCLAVLSRHNIPYEALIHFLIIINTVLGRQYLPFTKKLLWRALNRNGLGIRIHAYCKRCLRGLGLYKHLEDQVVCDCGLNIPKRQVAFFVEVSVERQLKSFLKRNGAGRLLFSKLVRQKKIENAIEDIYDGAWYKALEQGNGPLSSPNNFSYNLNSDGMKVTTTSSIQMWPIYIRINEVPMKLRQKFLFLAGVWIGRAEPDMNLFLNGFVDQANRLSTTGIDWRPDGHQIVNSKFVPLCMTVDSKARCIMMNQVGPTGYYACNFCTIEGVQAHGVKFPILPHHNHPAPEPRTDETVRRDMENRQHGFLGRSVLMNLEHFDLVKSLSTDDLHPIFEGVFKFHLELLLDTEDAPGYIGTAQNKAMINTLVKRIRVPTLLSRCPRDLTTIKKWRGHELRNFLIYYSVPVFRDLIQNNRHMNLLKMLSRATFLVMKDSITEDDLQEAERLFHSYVTEFERIFTVSRMRYNVHILLHIVPVVRLLGNLFVHSTHNFESWNMKIRRKIKSMKDPLKQLITRHLIQIFVSSVPEDDSFSERVRNTVREILDGVQRKEVTRVGEVLLLGKATHRRPTPSERIALNQRGIQCDVVSEYLRAQYHRLETRSVGYTVPGMNDNRNIYTWDDMFCQIQSILAINTAEGQKCFLFVTVYNTDEPVDIVSHMLHVNDGALVYDIFPFENLRNFAIIVENPPETYIMPMPNSSELD